MGKSLRVAHGGALIKLGEKNGKVVIADTDLAHATQTGMLKDKYPKHFYNVGIAETNMMCAAAGFAHTGYVPFVGTFALFGTDRAFEQIRNSTCYANCNIKFGSSHSSLCVGEDGGGHQFIEDIALMRELPHVTIFVPCDPAETERAVMAVVKTNGPVYIHVARPVYNDITTAHTPFIPDRASAMKEGNDVCLIAYGLMIPKALEVAAELEKEGSGVAVTNMRAIKPIGKDIVLKVNESCKTVVTVGEHSVIGGLGSAVTEVLASHNNAKFAAVDIEDKFGKSGKPDQLFEAYGLTAADVAVETRELLE